MTTVRKQKVCPACDVPFARRKAGCCPACGAEIYLPSYGSKLYRAGEVLLLSEKEAADNLIGELEEHISERDGVAFRFQGAEVSAQRGYVYQIILRARAFFKRQRDNLGLSSAEFVVKLFHKFLDINWWFEHLNSFRQLLSKRSGLSDKAKELYLDIRQERNTHKSGNATFSTMMALAEGVK